MPRFAANLSMMFQEWSFLDRFACAAEAGFKAVEYLFPYDHHPEAVGKALSDAGLEQVLFNLPPGDWAAGERGLAALPGREPDFRAAVDRALVYAEATGVPRLHAMSGLADADDAAARRTYLENLAFAADRLAERGLDLLIEPINPRSMPGYFLGDFRMADDVLATLNRPNLKLQFDVFHRQILHGDILTGLADAIGRIGHVQIAGVPDRHEPDTGEVRYEVVFEALDRLGYDGWVGCEYLPSGGTEAGLGWLRPWLGGAAGGRA